MYKLACIDLLFVDKWFTEMQGKEISHAWQDSSQTNY